MSDCIVKPLKITPLGVLLLLCCQTGSVRAQELAESTLLSSTQFLEPLTLIQKSLQVHPAIRATQSDMKVSRLDEAIAQQQGYPTPSAQIQLSEDYRSAKISIEQPLWAAGRLAAIQKKAFFDHQSAINSDQAERYDVAAKVLDAWGTVLDAHARMQAASQILHELEQFADMMRRRVDSGVSARFELDLVDSRILQSRVSYENAQQMIRLGQVHLAELLADNTMMQKNFTLPDLVTLSEKLKDSYQPESMLSISAQGNSHPLVKQAQSQVSSTLKQADISRANQYPQMMLGYQYNNQRYYHQPSSDQKDGQFYFSVQYNPGAGWSGRLSEQSLRAKAVSLQERTAATQQQIDEQIHQQLHSFLSAQGRIKTLNAAMSSARLVQESYQRQFIAGHKSWLELMNATREIEQSAYDLSSTRSALIVSYYQLQLLTGELDSVLNSNPDETSHDSRNIPISATTP